MAEKSGQEDGFYGRERTQKSQKRIADNGGAEERGILLVGCVGCGGLTQRPEEAKGRVWNLD
jgi:hypothetical protein